eukprot:TRINITY_DN14741_c1_g1_i1.p1 TRINITY_DN14741_c1_g1~~TRINITY_DN14741_c1_g1_i1.p1  ORF type:complete len:152 (-),score=21.31 TRINITY_DN14741_c1_g1_i1:77-532(-)
MDNLSNTITDAMGASLLAGDPHAVCAYHYRQEYPTYQIFSWFPGILILVNFVLIQINQGPEKAELMVAVETAMGGVFLVLGMLLSFLKPRPPYPTCTYASFPYISDWDTAFSIALAPLWFQIARAYQQVRAQHAGGQAGGENPAAELASAS